MIIPSHMLQFQNLETIFLKKLDLVEEVFEAILEGTTNNENSGFSESQIVVEISNLKIVVFARMDNLKCLWKGNQCMALEFPKLTSVFIHSCKMLEHLFTCSMVGSLVQLQDLHIRNCPNLTSVVKEEEWDVRENDQIIRLPRLESIELYTLPSLKGFCLGKKAFSWPSLESLEITDCPEITVFTNGQLSTPALKTISTSFGPCDVTEDVNSFIKTKQEEVHLLVPALVILD
ncbi:putative leucine-rich repeat domain, L domain-like protein [Tanacetum coccineum]